MCMHWGEFTDTMWHGMEYCAQRGRTVVCEGTPTQPKGWHWRVWSVVVSKWKRGILHAAYLYFVKFELKQSCRKETGTAYVNVQRVARACVCVLKLSHPSVWGTCGRYTERKWVGVRVCLCERQERKCRLNCVCARAMTWCRIFHEISYFGGRLMTWCIL